MIRFIRSVVSFSFVFLKLVIISAMTTKFLVFLAILLSSYNGIRADWVIEVKDANVVVNSVGYVDVLIYSTESDGLSIFGYDFRISGDFSKGELKFLGREQFTEENIADYVLTNDNSDFVILEEDSGFRITGGDDTLNGTADFTDVDVSTTPKTLVRLIVQHSLLSPEDVDETVGDEFTISLWNDDTTFLFAADGSSTAFDDGSEPNTSVASGTFLNSGKITIVATPEPATWLLLSSAVATFWGSRRLRAKRSPASKPA